MTDTHSETLTGAAPAAGSNATLPNDEPPVSFRFSRQISVLSDPNSVEAESIGSLRTHLLAQHIRDGRRSLAICAPSPDTGASYVAVNLAASLASAGISTLLVDADMRSPSIEEYIKPSRPVPGLQQLLADDPVAIADAIQSEVVPNLSVLFSGGATPNAQELLASRNFKTMIEGFMRDFEATIVDAPPGNVSADCLRVATACRYALLIARKNDTFVTDLRTLVTEMQADRVKIIGSYLNDL